MNQSLANGWDGNNEVAPADPSQKSRVGLLVIDVQAGFKDPQWGTRSAGPEFEDAIADLLAAWRGHRRPVIHVNHDSLSPDGKFRPGTPGNAPAPEAIPLEGEIVVHKAVNSAFIGTDLEQTLHREQINRIVVIGLTTNHCVSTTVRMAGNLGFETYVVSDATATFDRMGMDGRIRSAKQVHVDALSDLHEEFATVITAAEAKRLLRSNFAHWS